MKKQSHCKLPSHLTRTCKGIPQRVGYTNSIFPQSSLYQKRSQRVLNKTWNIYYPSETQKSWETATWHFECSPLEKKGLDDTNRWILSFSYCLGKSGLTIAVFQLLLKLERSFWISAYIYAWVICIHSSCIFSVFSLSNYFPAQNIIPNLLTSRSFFSVFILLSLSCLYSPS